ncbi:hypothetical protein [Hymenobacter qilianensis]|uniref:Uncharacterized protein n=1 Tax=Hymenobacter qilianensis TaxID=1385715 RepID=A0A7H0GXA2_9BACT|nr:hypothetical protein [Hymenobacter qilianensis]QNP52918.1 hypothetical protein H9L05_04200 [Hymenobacter qilianensis]
MLAEQFSAHVLSVAASTAGLPAPAEAAAQVPASGREGGFPVAECEWLVWFRRWQNWPHS